MLKPIKWHLSQNFYELYALLENGLYLIKTLDGEICTIEKQDYSYEFENMDVLVKLQDSNKVLWWTKL